MGERTLEDWLAQGGPSDVREWGEIAPLIRQALRANDELRAALKPFAEAYNDDGPEWDEQSAWESPCAMSVTYGDFRRADLATQHHKAD